MALKLITPPAEEPLSVMDIEAQVRADLSLESDLVTAYISAIRAKAETYLRRALITQTWELVLDAFPDVVKVPLPPLQSVNSITYIDQNGTTQTLASTGYKVDTDTEPARIVPAYGLTWPVTRGEIGAVRIRFKAGYGDTAANVPECVKQWMRLNVANLYENRESVVQGTIPTEVKSLADGLLDAVPGGRAFEF